MAHTTIGRYFEILVDCLVAERIEPITESRSRKRLIKASRFLLFDMGVRRHAAQEGTHLIPQRMGQLFEQFVGLELLRQARLETKSSRLRYWKDSAGPEVDWVLEQEGTYVPIEVKWSENPSPGEVKHLHTFLEEYKNAPRGYVICRTPRRLKLSSKVDAIPWQEIPTLFD